MVLRSSIDLPLKWEPSVYFKHSINISKLYLAGLKPYWAKLKKWPMDCSLLKAVWPIEQSLIQFDSYPKSKINRLYDEMLRKDHQSRNN
jgi:hypothetical protein